MCAILFILLYNNSVSIPIERYKMPTVTARFDDDVAEILKLLGDIGLEGLNNQSDVFRAAVKHFIATLDMDELRAFMEKRRAEQIDALDRFIKLHQQHDKSNTD